MKQFIILAAFSTVLFGFTQTSSIDSLTVTLAYQKQDSAKVVTSMYLVKAFYDGKNFKKALLYIEQTERLAKQLNFLKGIADANYYRALIYTQKDDYYNAIDGFKTARNLYTDLGDTLGIAKVNNSIGLMEIKRGNLEIGLKNSLSAIKIFEASNLRSELSIAYNNLAEAYFKTNQKDKSLEFNLKALSVREDLRDTLGIINSNKNIALLYSQRKEHRKAIEYYEKLIKLITNTKNDSIKGALLPRIGNEYLQFKNYDKAVDYLVEGLKLNRRNKNDEGVLRALNAMGQLNLEKGKTRLSRSQLNEAYDIANRINDREQLLTTYKLQKELDSTLGQYQNAFFWQGKYYALKAELEPENNLKLPESISWTKAEATSETKNFNSSVLFQEELAKQRAQQEYLKVVAYILGGILVLAIASIIFLIYWYERKKDIAQPTAINKKTEIERNELLQKNKDYQTRIENLEEVNSVKDRLFSIVSHDLKDSISSIKAFIDLIKQGNISTTEFYDLVPELSENADNAMELLYNLLNWSKTQMQNLEPKAEVFNIQEVFHNKMSLVEQKTEQKDIKLVDNSHRDFVYADKSMIEIVIQNLITNAVKFTKPGDVITVSNNVQNGNSLIVVEDTGVGISKENINKLFKKGNFTTDGTNNEKGTGLGLTICKELVELNNGKIWVESKVGVGTKFFVELPKMEAV